MSNNEHEFLLNKLKEISLNIGSNKNYIQASGGNTSCKIHNDMYVKASGKCLKNALNENIFLLIKFREIAENIKNGEINNYKSTSSINSRLRVSIETGLHAIIPNTFVIHSHPIDVIAQTVLKDAKVEIEKKLKGYNWSWIEYTKPGNYLAKKIFEIIKNKDMNIFILQNHGLVVGGQDHNEVLKLHNKLIKLLALESRNYKIADLKLLKGLVNKLRKKGMSCRLPKNRFVHSLGTDSWSLKLVKENPLYPDHLVFCGRYPLIIKEEEINVVENKFLDNYKYIIIENIGVVLFDSLSRAGEEMLEAQSKINLKIPIDNQINFLSDHDCDELTNWDAEIYRILLNNYDENKNKI